MRENTDLSCREGPKYNCDISYKALLYCLTLSSYASHSILNVKEDNQKYNR